MDTKPWWQSLTIWGSVVSALVIGFGLFHVDIKDQAGPLTTGIAGTVGLIATIITIIGRVRARTVITSQTPLDPNGPLMRLLLLGAICASLVGRWTLDVGRWMFSLLLAASVALALQSCATGPVHPNSPLAVVGSDFTADAAAALQAYADYKAGNVSLTWALTKMFNAYALSTQTSTDVQSLIKAWTGGTGDSRALADRLARIFNASTAPPQTKMAALAVVAQNVAQDKGS
jgi:hypothetical protein